MVRDENMLGFGFGFVYDHLRMIGKSAASLCPSQRRESDSFKSISQHPVAIVSTIVYVVLTSVAEMIVSRGIDHNSLQTFS